MIEISDAELATRRIQCQHYWVPVYDRVKHLDPKQSIGIDRPIKRCVLCQKVES